MAKSNPYHPDYKKVYAGTYISPEVMRVLKQSDRKMEYMEVDIKRERKKRRKGKPIENYNQGKELSLDKFAEDDLVEFVSPELSPEEIAILLEQLRTLDKSRLLEYIGTVDQETMRQVDEAFRISVGHD